MFSLGLSYTGMSRVKRIQDLAFDPMPCWKRLDSFSKRAIFKKRLKEDERLSDLEEAFLLQLDLENSEINDDNNPNE